jgi:hypothetical protein
LPHHLADTTHHSIEEHPLFKDHPWFSKDGEAGYSASLADAIKGNVSPMAGTETDADAQDASTG